MKFATFFNSGLIIASIALIPGVASAQTANLNKIMGQTNTDLNSNTLGEKSTNVSYLQPFNIAFLAYQGNLKEQGIPSGSALISEYQIGKLTAKDLVEAAIRANKLPAQVLNNPGYLNAVDSQLTSLGNTNDSCN